MSHLEPSRGSDRPYLRHPIQLSHSKHGVSESQYLLRVNVKVLVSDKKLIFFMITHYHIFKLTLQHIKNSFRTEKHIMKNPGHGNSPCSEWSIKD